MRGNGAPRGSAEQAGDVAGPPPARPSDGVRWDRVAEVLAADNGVWAVQVLRHLGIGESRPGDLLTAIHADPDFGMEESRPDDWLATVSAQPGSRLSQKVLFDVLRRLERDGLIGRTAAAAWLREVRYWLTAAGHEILTLVSKLGSADSGWLRYRDGEEHLMGTDPEPPRGVDPTVARPARVWDFYLGGKDNFRGDRETGGASVAAMPSMHVLAQSVRLFQADAIRTLVSRGVRQFLDIGAGLTVEGSVHEITRVAAPESRIVYVDNDPVVVTHTRALFRGAGGAYDHVEADLRDPGGILAHAARTLDLSRPVAVFLVGVAHFLSDQEDPWGCIARLRAGVTGDLYIVLTHGASDLVPEEADGFEAEYNRTAVVKIKLRDQAAVARFFDGMEMIPPGLVPINQWPTSDSRTVLSGYVGIGLQPGRLQQ